MSFIFLILLCQIQNIFSTEEGEQGYGGPRIGRNNVVNKGVWIRNNKENDKTGNFMFRGNSMDLDNIDQGDFNAFGDGPNSPFISSYVERSKRSLDDDELGRFRKSLTNANTIDANDALIKSKLITKLKPASVFNDYPYEIAILLSNDKVALDGAKNYSTYVINELLKQNESLSVIPIIDNSIVKIDEIDKEVYNKSNSTIVPKRSMNHYESEVIKKIEIMEDINKNVSADASNSFTRDVFGKDVKDWKQNEPTPATHKYKVIGKSEDVPPKAVRPVTERGLFKVLTMLTSTFKKIMRQHSDIKDIHREMNAMNENFLKNMEIISDKFQDFETKYANLEAISQKLNESEENINMKEQHFKAKEKELAKNLFEFEIQQKKFLTQQRQFYNIQKLMLAQNERINAKQNAIAKTQSEISHRQNNFARILKKAKQIYIDNRIRYNPTKTTTAYTKSDMVQNSETNNETETEDIERKSSTHKPLETTEPVKINLFSIPVPTKLENQDHLLLNEKDDQPVDDLVYKYYFNNTFINTLMKNYLSGFATTADSDNSKNVKNKRNEIIVDGTTILLPVNKTINNSNDNLEEAAGISVIRKRRWINHHSKKFSRRNRGKKEMEKTEIDDEKLPKNLPVAQTNAMNKSDEPVPTAQKKSPIREKTIVLQKDDAFISMATAFCNRIGQNTSKQILDWCIEKALRRLQNIDIKVPLAPYKQKKIKTKHAKAIKGLGKIKEKSIKEITTPLTNLAQEPVFAKDPLTLPDIISNMFSNYDNVSIDTNPIAEAAIKSDPMLLDHITKITSTDSQQNLESTTLSMDAFFPDNDQLEINLKQFDSKPDTEGTVYYDGSLHASDMIKGVFSSDPDSNSENLPALDNSSRIENVENEDVDRRALRREFIKRSLLSRMRYERMLKKKQIKL